jgi:hypothetical protein
MDKAAEDGLLAEARGRKNAQKNERRDKEKKDFCRLSIFHDSLLRMRKPFTFFEII